MRISRRDGKTSLNQIPYLEKILKCTDTRTLLPTGYKPQPFSGTTISHLKSQYQSVISSLLYLMLGTCPDIIFAVTQMAKFIAN
ncbi:hypothetical protein M413DRAFT_423302, partial [Hebeloma cylindrosporum]